MKKVVIAMSAIVMLIAVTIWGIGAYLYIDDLHSCGQRLGEVYRILGCGSR